jgi:hypothetical protein
VLAPGLGLLLIGPLAALGAGFGAIIGGVYAVPNAATVRTDIIEDYKRQVLAGKVLLHVHPRDAADEAGILQGWERIHGAQVRVS